MCGVQNLTLDEERKMDDVSQVVVAGDAGVPKQPLEVVFDTLDDDVGVNSKDRDKRLHVIE